MGLKMGFLRITTVRIAVLGFMLGFLSILVLDTQQDSKAPVQPLVSLPPLVMI